MGTATRTVFIWPSSKPKGPSLCAVLTWQLKLDKAVRSVNLIAPSAHQQDELSESTSPPLRRIIQLQAESIGDVMTENSHAVRLARVVGGVAVLAGVMASIASCSGKGSNEPSTTQSPTMTTTTTVQSPAPGSPPPAPR